jgi:hypothetical protein
MNGLTPIKVEDMLSQIADWAIESNAADAVLIRMRTLILTTVLELEGGNQCKAAVRLGMHRNTLWRRCMNLEFRPGVRLRGMDDGEQREGNPGAHLRRSRTGHSLAAKHSSHLWR